MSYDYHEAMKLANQLCLPVQSIILRMETWNITRVRKEIPKCSLTGEMPDLPTMR